MQSSLSTIIKVEDNRNSDYSEQVRRVDNRDRQSSDIIGWSG